MLVSFRYSPKVGSRVCEDSAFSSENIHFSFIFEGRIVVLGGFWLCLSKSSLFLRFSRKTRCFRRILPLCAPTVPMFRGKMSRFLWFFKEFVMISEDYAAFLLKTSIFHRYGRSEKSWIFLSKPSIFLHFWRKNRRFERIVTFSIKTLDFPWKNRCFERIPPHRSKPLNLSQFPLNPYDRFTMSTKLLP